MPLRFAYSNALHALSFEGRNVGKGCPSTWPPWKLPSFAFHEQHSKAKQTEQDKPIRFACILCSHSTSKAPKPTFRMLNQALCILVVRAASLGLPHQWATCQSKELYQLLASTFFDAAAINFHWCGHLIILFARIPWAIMTPKRKRTCHSSFWSQVQTKTRCWSYIGLNQNSDTILVNLSTLHSTLFMLTSLTPALKAQR